MGRKRIHEIKYPSCRLTKDMVDTAFKKSRKALVYSLAHPETKEIFYVGSTYIPYTRISNHRKTFGFTPIFEVIEVCERLGDHRGRVGLSNAEAYWIAQFTEWGFQLTNKLCNPKLLTKKILAK